MRADLLELADVLVHLRRRGHHRPDSRDLRAPHIEESGADRRGQPLVQGRPVVVAVEIVALEREMAIGVRPIHDHFDAARAAQLRDPLHRKDLARQVRDVADVDDLRPRRDRLLDAARQVILRRRRHGEGDLLQDDAVPALALLPRGDHARVILRRRQHLVPALQRHAELHDLQRLARVPGDRHFFGIAAEARRQPAPHRLDLRLDPAPHRDGRSLVGYREVALQRRIHDPRTRRDAAVVQVDHAAVDVECLLNRPPVVLVLRDVGGGAPHGAPRDARYVRERAIGEGRHRRRRGDERVQEAAAGHGRHRVSSKRDP